MNTIHNILLATDFSPSSQAAMQYAVAAAKQYGARVFIVHMIPESVYASVPPEILAHAKTRTIADAKARLEELRPGFKDLQTEIILKEGPVDDTLLALTESESIDLLVVGTRGHRRMERLLLGSVAEKLSRQARCPVLIVPESAVAYEPKIAISTILCPTNFSERSVAALNQAWRLAKAFSARIILLHVVEGSVPSRADRIGKRTILEQRLRNLSSSLAGGEPASEAQLEIEFGAPARTIVRVAAERHPDLIVLSTERAKPVVAHLPAEITYSVARQVSCPVLTIAS